MIVYKDVIAQYFSSAVIFKLCIEVLKLLYRAEVACLVTVIANRTVADLRASSPLSIIA